MAYENNRKNNTNKQQNKRNFNNNEGYNKSNDKGKKNKGESNYEYEVKKNYILYKRKDIENDKVLEYLKKRKNKINKDEVNKDKINIEELDVEDVKSGFIEGTIEVVTPLYSEGRKEYCEKNNENSASQSDDREMSSNNLVIETTFRSQIRRTMELIDFEKSVAIFGNLNEKSKVEFINLENLNQVSLWEEELKFENLGGKKAKEMTDEEKTFTKLHYNDVKQFNNTEKSLYSFNSKTKKNKGITKIKGAYKKGSKFKFKVLFYGLLHEELLILINSLILEKDEYKHQIGYGKSKGLGTINVSIDNIELKSKSRFDSLFSKKYQKTNVAALLNKAQENIKKDLSDALFVTYKPNKK